ncbi:response regulator [Paenibacillus thalictri]|uniref:Response regulator n=1 Tax=Paenibacillus thalictri TaxID=2527873 RepID=A0A4Q9DVG1_9BACL|nr:response regulator [Paenibacillus thalictri]TBL78971.1 response regulator [Paenibacillus thalictri]
MLKVLIVDDQAVSRTDLKTMLDWENCGFYIYGEAHNGIYAMQLMEKEVPDIVITDINMPGMNGLGLIELLERDYPQVRIVVLSAYDDFEFVRQSMKRGAMDYVLKHRLNAPLLLELLKAAENSILMYRNERDKQHEMVQVLTIRKNMQRQELIKKLLEGSLPDRADALGQIRMLDVAMDTENLMVAAAEIDDFPFIEEKFSSKEIDVLVQTFLDISCEMLSDWDKSVISPMGGGKFAIILSMGRNHSRMYIYNQLYTFLNRIRSEIKKYLNMTASFGVSDVCRDIMQLHQAYNEAASILKDKFHKGKNGIYIESAGSSKHEEGFFSLDIKDEKAIYAALKNQDFESVKRLIGSVFDKISSLRLSSKSTLMICAELINIVNKASKDAGVDMSKLYTAGDIPYHLMQKYEVLMDMKTWILNLYDRLIHILQQMKILSSYSEVTQRAVEYIHRNYNNDVSLQDAADYAGVSGSYISRLFKEECRMGFTEYVNHVRVEHAKRHIEQGELKLKEIVSHVGFNNYNYFFKVFKEVAGMTPLEYETTCRK